MLSLALASALLGLAAASPLNNQPRQTAGKCTIGMEFTSTNIPTFNNGPIRLSNSYSYIVGSNGAQTNFPLERTERDLAQGSGDYAGTQQWTIRGDIISPFGDVDYCVVKLGDVEFDSRNAPEGTCDTYKGAAPFQGKGGCRCRFDCA